jgi:hypothetical protein
MVVGIGLLLIVVGIWLLSMVGFSPKKSKSEPLLVTDPVLPTKRDGHHFVSLLWKINVL